MSETFSYFFSTVDHMDGNTDDMWQRKGAASTVVDNEGSLYGTEIF